MRAYLLRSAPYKYSIEGKNLYQSFNAVIGGEVEVPIVENGMGIFKKRVPKDLFKNVNVYTSQRLACRQTANFISKKPIICSELAEIGYTMKDFIRESDFYTKSGDANVGKARKLFVKAFIEDRLLERRNDVFDRMDKIKNLIMVNKSGSVVFVSHGFFIKVFEAYIRDKKLREGPKRLLKYFDGKIETFKFCEGIILKTVDDNIFFDSYI